LQHTHNQAEVIICGYDFVDAIYMENLEKPNDDGIITDSVFSHNMKFVTYEAINFINNDYDGADTVSSLNFLGLASLFFPSKSNRFHSSNIFLSSILI